MELRFPLILDGATGTELQKRGYTGDVSAEQWVLAHPDSILSIQRDYVAAGSQVLYTPTFGGNAIKLAEHGVTEDTAAYNRRLADLSRQAANGKALLDLKGVNARRLVQLGVPAGQIAVSDACTMCRPDVFWSHRATDGRRGVQAAVITL